MPTKLLDFVRLPQSIDERRQLALGPHNLSKVKAKHETAQEISSKSIDGSRQESGKPVPVDDGTQKVLTLSSRHDAVQKLSDGWASPPGDPLLAAGGQRDLSALVASNV